MTDDGSIYFDCVFVTYNLSYCSPRAGSAYNLFAFPSECNFSGLKFSLELVKTVKEDSIRYSDGSPSSK